MLESIQTGQPLEECKESLGVHSQVNLTDYEGFHVGAFEQAIFIYRTSDENVKLSPPVQRNASPDDNSRTAITISINDVTGMKAYPDLFLYQLALRIACGPETTLIRKKDTTPLIRCSVFVLLTAF
ncbi:hypothetical protein TNCV_699311 [Trichonephila clavipes]|nr:hypothetical protein TNCV_699311 [Trichonephila clavipes]